jgi:hypothetical protein
MRALLLPRDKSFISSASSPPKFDLLNDAVGKILTLLGRTLQSALTSL